MTNIEMLLRLAEAKCLQRRDVAVRDPVGSPPPDAVGLNAERLAELNIGPAMALGDCIEQL
jgi:hypothetical protein